MRVYKGNAPQLKILNRHRLYIVCKLKAEDARVEINLAIKRTLDILRTTKAVLLALEGNVGDGQAFRAQSINHHLRLIRQHNLVFQTLKEDHGTREPINMMN